MNSVFTIVPNYISPPKGLKKVGNTSEYLLLSNNETNAVTKNGILIYIDGYVIPVNDCFEKYSKHNQHDLVFALFQQYQTEFAKKIKGAFVIVIISANSLHIISDYLGLVSFFYAKHNKHYIISNSFKAFQQVGTAPELDPVSIKVCSILNRNTQSFTSFKNIFISQAATRLILSGIEGKIENYWSPSCLLSSDQSKIRSHSFSDFSCFIKQSFKNFNSFLEPENHAITLTGGKDSRTGLAALLSIGIEPYGFTYGNEQSKDSVYAKKLASQLGLKHQTFTPPCSYEWWDMTANEIVSYGNPEVSIHRAHRLYAFTAMAEILKGSSAYFAGYMAGEFLMGVYYDNLVFTKYLTDYWENPSFKPMEQELKNGFIKEYNFHNDDVLHRLSQLRSFDKTLTKKERQFYGIFEIGIPHHCQDIFLASKHFDYVYPFFIDIDFLQEIFNSEYSFFHTDNKTRNLYKRYKLYEFNLNIQHLLGPAMDNVPFAKRGSYTTSDFLKGKLYWTMVKGFRYFSQRRKYPVSFSYDVSFKEFIKRGLSSLANNPSHTLHKYYNVNEALLHLAALEGDAKEGVLRGYSNIISLLKQMQ